MNNLKVTLTIPLVVRRKMTCETYNIHTGASSSRQRLHGLLSSVGLLLLLLASVQCFTFQTPSVNTERILLASSWKASRQWPLKSSPLGKEDDEVNMVSLEREVMEATRAKLDLKRISTEFLGGDVTPPTNTLQPTQEKTQQISSYYSPFAVAIASGGVAAGIIFGAWHNLPLAVITCLGVFLVANGDPLEEDSVAGALARVVGRATLQSVEASQPKVRAVARAAVRGEDELINLQERIDQLEKENAKLLLWQQRRMYVDEALPRYNVEELKSMARQNNLAVGGTKGQLLMRLVEAQVIDITS